MPSTHCSTRPTGGRPSVRLPAAAILGLLLATPAAHAQGGLLERIKDNAKGRAAAAATRAAAAVATKSGAVADTTLQAGVVGVDSLSGRAAGGAVGVVGKVRKRLPGAIGGMVVPPGMGAAVKQAGEQLSARGGETGPTPADTAEDLVRIPLQGVMLAAGVDTLDLVAVSYLRQLATGLGGLGGAWTVQAILPPGGDPARIRARAERRATAVRAVLIGAGVPAARITAVGRVADVQTAPEQALAPVFLLRRP